MKKLSLLFFLPLLVFGQPMNPIENDLAAVDFNMEIVVQLELENKIDKHQFNDYIPSVSANLKTSVTVIQNIPKHLNTYTIARLFLSRQQSFAPQERLDSLLALNNPEFPKENTLIKGLNAVRYSTKSFGGAENMPEGFGPKIRL